MIPLTFSALDPELVAAVRRTRRDARGEAVEVWISDGPGNPCRACLRLTPAGTPLLLFAHQPFRTGGPYAERGPVFIHADACDAYATVDAFPADFNGRPLTLRGYSAEGRIVDAAVAPPGGALETLAALFADPRVAFVHARSPSWGCYDFEVRCFDRLSMTLTVVR
jgi:hypothetical protein